MFFFGIFHIYLDLNGLQRLKGCVYVWVITAFSLCPVWKCVFHVTLLWPSPVSFSGEMRVQLLNQSLLDLGLYDDGPYEVADQKQLNAQLIPVPYHSYLGRICPRCSLLPEHRREREGWGGTTLGLRMYPKMATGTRASNSSKMSLIGNFLWIISVQVWNVKHCCYDFTKGLEWEEDGKMSRAHCGLSSIPLKPTLLVWNVFYSLTEEECVYSDLKKSLL